MRIQLEIEGVSPKLAFDIVGKGGKMRSGDWIDAPGGAAIEFTGEYGQRSVDVVSTLQFIVEASITVDLALFTTWLYDKIRDHRPTRITINRREVVEISAERIKKVLEEEINING